MMAVTTSLGADGLGDGVGLCAAAGGALVVCDAGAGETAGEAEDAGAGEAPATGAPVVVEVVADGGGAF